ncbi:hemagglutinin repeat-containing protein, partial [Pasteurella atlantica]|uniref:hemagglutinin repeat-containing protein n=1 Tax=Pasteurellaceae TaxID=712 RepID=UPI002750FAC2
GKSTLQTQTGDIDIVGSSVVSEGDNIINAAGDVNIVSTQNSKNQSESHKSKGIGSAQISDTERFDGYMSGRSNASDQSVEQVRSLVGSEAGNVHIQAGGHYRQQVADVLADKDISVRAKSINILEDMNSGNSHQSSKDLKIGQFTKVSSPLIDLVNAVDEARKSKANDRVKSLQGLSVASRGYQAYDTVKNGGALVKVETGVGFKTAKSQQDSQYALSQSNKLDAGGNVNLTSIEGNIHLQNTDINAGNLIALDSAKEILLESGESHKKADGSNSSAGLSVGVGASVGAQTGVYVYGEAGWSQGENHLDSNTHRNTTLTSDKLSLTSKGNTTLRGATAKANRIDADIGGELTIESPQDVVKQSSEQTGVGARVQLSLGTAWEVSGNASHSEGKSNHQQVNEQSGLFAGDGGYHVTAKNVDLKGGAIASTNAKNSELITNKITFSDVQNQSESSAVSVSLSGKTGENEYGQDITGVSPSLPMKDGNNDSSITKATLTEGKITLNKDTNPTQTTAKALGINTELTNANVQTETPNDVGEMLKEQSTINSAIGDVSSAVNTYTQSKQKEVAEKLKTAKTPQEVAEIQAEAESWGVGGSNKRAVDTVTTLLTTALAGKSPTEIAAATASPYLNETIHKATEGNKTANLLAHAVLSAVEFNVAGLDPTVGALSGVAGEGTAMVLAEKVFNKPANQLTPKEKNILITASTLAGSLVGATGGSVESANTGGVSAKTAVENNLLSNEESNIVFDISEKFDKKGGLLKNDRERMQYLLSKDQRINRLLQRYQKDPNTLSDKEKSYLDMRLMEIAKADNMSIDKLYNWDFNSSINWTNPELMSYLGKMDQYEQDPVTRIAEGVGEGLFLVTNPEASVLKGVQTTTNVIKKGINLAKKYPKLTETVITGSIDTGYDIYNKEFTPEKMGLNYVKAGVTAGKSLSQRLSIGMGTTLLLSGNDPNKSDKEIAGDLLGVGLSTLGGHQFSKVLDKTKLPTFIKQATSDTFSKELENKVKEKIIQGDK